MPLTITLNTDPQDLASYKACCAVCGMDVSAALDLHIREVAADWEEQRDKPTAPRFAAPPKSFNLDLMTKEEILERFRKRDEEAKASKFRPLDDFLADFRKRRPDAGV
jgi:hypothetical protein